MDLFYAVLLSSLEMTFIFVGLCLLFSQRKIIGSSAFYLALGLIFLFSQFVCAADLRVFVGSVEFQIGSTILFLPYFAAMLLVYITDGTLAAQRLIIGSLVMFGVFLYLEEITRLQCDWVGFAIGSGLPSDSLHYLLTQSRRSMVALTVVHLLDLFMIPVIYTRLSNLKCQLFFRVLGALSFSLLADSVLYALMVNWRQPDWFMLMSGSLAMRAVAIVWLSLLLTMYLKKVERTSAHSERSPLDIFFAFLGGYGRSKILEENLKEWEGRYRQILSNASEMIMLISTDGRIIEANNAAASMLGSDNPEALAGAKIEKHLHNPDGSMFDLPQNGSSHHFLTALTGEISLSCSLTLQILNSRPVWVLIGRDITEEIRLAQEKERLSEQLVHAQRIEALGQLAGGIAHDFNNHIHGVLGHVDIINLMYPPENQSVSRHLKKIAEIAEQSGKLTAQLLGFARKGKYQITDIDLNELAETSLEMLMPQKRCDMTIDFTPASSPAVTSGDRIQLQQVLLNLMLNASDAMAENKGERILTVTVGNANAVDIPLEPAENCTPDDYICVMIKDTGHGMSEETAKHIFEPFFSTKPDGKGTGMGLSMVYGAVTSHHGWIQVKSTEEQGTAFYVFLPSKTSSKD